MFLESRPHNEFIGKIQDAMRVKNFDYLLLTSPENINYSTGYISGMYGMWKPGSEVALIPKNGSPYLIVSEFMKEGAKNQTSSHVKVIDYPSWIFIEDYFDPNQVEKPVQPGSDVPIDYAIDIIKSFNNHKVTRIGIEKSNLSLTGYEKLQLNFDENQIIDCDELLTTLRSIKLNWEIDVLRYSAEIAEKMMKITMMHTKPGVTEEYLFEIWYKSAIELTECKELVGIQQAHTPGSDFWATQIPRNNILREGDIVRLDGGVNICGYISDLGRVYAVGDTVSEDKQKIFDTLLAARDVGIDLIKPGNTFSQVFQETMKVCNDGALPHFTRGHVGHTIGMGPGEEFPMINKDNEQVFEKNMVLCFETPYYSSKYGSYNLEDMVLVTEDGYELFTNTNRILFI